MLVVGGLATYLYVEEAEPDAGRLTRDIDIVVRREDLERMARAAEEFGLRLRHVAGIDMLIRVGESSVRRAVHMVFAGEKVVALPAIRCRSLTVTARKRREIAKPAFDFRCR